MSNVVPRAVVENELGNPSESTHRFNLRVYDAFVIHLKNRKRCVVNLDTLIYIAEASQNGGSVDILVNSETFCITFDFPIKIQVGDDEYCYMYQECDHIVISTNSTENAVQVYKKGGIKAEKVIPVCIPTYTFKNNILELIYYQLAGAYTNNHETCLAMVNNRIVLNHNLPTGVLVGETKVSDALFVAGKQQSTVK